MVENWNLVENLNFGHKLEFWSKIELCEKFNRLPNFFKLSNFSEYLDFSHKLSFLTQTFELWPKCQCLMKISIFSPPRNFWPKFSFLVDYFKPLTSPIEAHSAPNPSFFASSRTPEIGHDFIATAWSQSGRFVFIFKSRAFLSQCKIHV